jgi:hypothetical protein
MASSLGSSQWRGTIVTELDFDGIHPILRALAAMERHIADNDPTSARKLLKKIVIDYKPSSSLVDHLQGKASERNETSPGLYVGCTESAEGFVTH